MQDSELQKLLRETCPVLPGQEGRAWSRLQKRIYGAEAAASGSARFHLSSWRGLMAGLAVFCALMFLGNTVFNRSYPLPLLSAKSEAPGIFATTFYSPSAQAQVVWLNGLDPASDKPTYLDPTSAIPGPGGDNE